MKTLLKISNWVAWVSACCGIFLMVCAFLSSVLRYYKDTLLKGGEYMFGVEHRVNFFQAATPFFLITILLFLFILMNQDKK